MPNIDFNEFQKNDEPKKEPKGYTVSRAQVTDQQYYIKEEDILFDILDLDFDGEGPGMEVLISLIGEDFKIRCDLVPKKVFDTFDIPQYLLGLIEEYKPCLECKKKFLEDLCSHDDIEFIPDDDEEA